MSEKKIFVSQDVKKFLGYEVGSRLHDDWKEDNRPKDENARQGYEARWKPAKTDGYVPGPGLEEVVREVDGVLEIDIANMSFEMACYPGTTPAQTAVTGYEKVKAAFELAL